MKLLIVAQNFQVGGIQRALINMLDHLCKDNKIDIDLFVFGDGPMLKDVPSNVRIIKGKRSLRLIATPLSVVKSSTSVVDFILRIILMVGVRLVGSKKLYHSLFKREKRLGAYDIAISYFNDVPGGYFNQGTNQFVDQFVHAGKKLAWIHNDPLIANFDRDDCREKYRNFDCIVCVSEACSRKLKEFLPEYADKVATVYNFFPIEKIHGMACEKTGLTLSDEISLITVSRIDNYQKAINVIPWVVSELIKSNITNFKWTIIGDGPNLDALKKRVEELNIREYLDFIGNQLNPYPFVKESSLFVLVSKFEGYPMVIGEALILGTPVLTTEFAAASEMVNSGKNGIIVDIDEKAIFSKLCWVLKHREEIRKMREYIVENPYTNSLAVQQLDSIINIGVKKSDKFM